MPTTTEDQIAGMAGLILRLIEWRYVETSGEMARILVRHFCRTRGLLDREVVRVDLRDSDAQKTISSLIAPREWIIQRCTQKWIGSELQYEDVARLGGGLYTRTEMIEVLENIGRQHPEHEFKGHNVSRCECHPRLGKSQDAAGLNPQRDALTSPVCQRPDLYGTGSRLHFMADEFVRLKLFAAARHYRALAALEDADRDVKTGQSPPSIHGDNPMNDLRLVSRKNAVPSRFTGSLAGQFDAEVYLDERALLPIVEKAIRNKSKQSKIGPLVVKVLRRMPSPAAAPHLLFDGKAAAAGE